MQYTRVQYFQICYELFCDWSSIPEYMTLSLPVNNCTMSNLILQILPLQQFCDLSAIPEYTTPSLQVNILHCKPHNSAKFTFIANLWLVRYTRVQYFQICYKLFCDYSSIPEYTTPSLLVENSHGEPLILRIMPQ